MRLPHVRRLRLAAGLVLALLIAAGLHAQQAPSGGPPSSSPPEPLRFRYVGPPSAGRFSAIAGHPRQHRRRTTPAPRRAACGRPATADRPGSRSSTISRCRPSERSQSRARAPTSSGQARAKHGPSETPTSWATASTSRSTAGKTWTHMGLRRDRAHRPHAHPPDQSRHRVRLRARAGRRARRRNAAYSARPTAAGRGSGCSS